LENLLGSAGEFIGEEMDILRKVDPEITETIEAEIKRQSSTLELIASENHASPAVLRAMGTVLTDKYAEGYPDKRYYCGCEHVDDIEQIALERAAKLFGAEHANVQPHSGTSANLGVYLAALKPGDKIMGMALECGGHLSHGLDLNISGKTYKAVQYGVNKETEMMDLDEIRKIALKERPDMLIVGASAYPRTIEFKDFADIANEVGCPLMSDVAHILGLIAGGVHPDPVPHSEFVTGTTHKTLRGPRGGLILSKQKWARKVDAAIFPGLQGGPLMHIIAAKAVAFHEALQPEFRQYAAAIIANAKVLAEELMSMGWRLVSGGTDNHLMLVDLRSKDADLTGATAAGWLASAGIVANKNKIPFDPRSAVETSGIRLGTPALTTRDMGAEQMKAIAGWIDHIIISKGDESAIGEIGGKVNELCQQFPIPSNGG